MLARSIAAYIVCLSVFVASDAVGQESENSFTPLFNGQNLDGWVGQKTLDPRKFEAMTEARIEAFRKSSAAATTAHWTVENGEIVNDGRGPFLSTLEEFEDYELILEYKTVPLADSGIYLKATPQVQIWDFTEAGGKWNIGADRGSGGLWNNSPGAAGKDPMVLADNPFGQWNKVRVIQVGARTTVFLNDKKVVDHATMENYWDRARPVVRKGPIQLQTHGGEIRWRKLVVRKIESVEANRLLTAAHDEGFETIFNGKDFTGWKGPVENYQVVDGTLMCKKGKGGTIYTDQEYSDFQARFEFKLPPAGNNGLAIRYPGQGDTAYAGMCELQILAADYPGKLDDRQFHGSAYGMVAAEKGYLRKNGDWNFQVVTVVGSTIKVELNGSIILNSDLAEVEEFLGDRPHPGKDRTSGAFGFAGHNDPVQFRNVAIKTLDNQ